MEPVSPTELLIDLNFWIGMIVGALLSYVVSVVSGPSVRWFTRWYDNRLVRRMLRFGTAGITVVIPHRLTEAGVRKFPFATFEDVMALKDISAVLADLGLPWSLKDPAHLTNDDRQNNLILIGGPNRNRVTGEILRTLPPKHLLEFVDTDVGETRQTVLRRAGTQTFESRTYQKEPEYLPLDESGDAAIVVRTQNPWNRRSSVLVLAGIRGIGTWGAADFLRQHGRDRTESFRRLERIGSEGFGAVLDVDYSMLKITDTRLVLAGDFRQS